MIHKSARGHIQFGFFQLDFLSIHASLSRREHYVNPFVLDYVEEAGEVARGQNVRNEGTFDCDGLFNFLQVAFLELLLDIFNVKVVHSHNSWKLFL
jgi:hypothetical protein